MTTFDATAVAERRRPLLVTVQERPLFELWGITKRWPKLPSPVLDGVDLLLERGTSTLVDGRNGIGKTTLLRIAAGLIRADDGIVSLDDLHPVRDRRAYQRRIGFASAGRGGLYARMSVRHHLQYWASLAFVPRSTRATVVAGALEAFSLEELSTRRVDRMSMGQRQRLRLAAAFLHDPDVVLLDEPRNSLDAEGTETLNRAIRRLTARGGAVLWCAPTGEEAQLEFDQRFVLEGGRLVEA